VERDVGIGAVTAGVVALLGAFSGLLWAVVSPGVRYYVVGGKISIETLVDLETTRLIGVDGRFALIGFVAGVLCGIAAYLAGGRGHDLALVAGLAIGGTLATLIAWRVGHQIGLGAFQHAVRTGKDGAIVTAPAELHALGVLVIWPLLAVVTFGVLEACDFAKRAHRLTPGYFGGTGAGQPYQIGGGQLDLQAAPSGGDVDGRET
jgi:hypothetical protein